jgi:hypothetical protein
MRPLSAEELLAIWEQGWGGTPSQQALALLAPACPESAADDLAALGIGERDWRLLGLREKVFGPHIAAVTVCPGCGQRLEIAMQVADVRVPEPPDVPVEGTALSVQDYEVCFRLPTAADLDAIGAETDLGEARNALLRRCLMSARDGGGDAVPVERLPEGVLSAVVTRMAEVDPQANVQLALACPSCQQKWASAFDIGRFFWAELDAWAQRLLRQVHALALAYGWREADIVAMSPLRRQMYLELIGT